MRALAAPDLGSKHAVEYARQLGDFGRVRHLRHNDKPVPVKRVDLFGTEDHVPRPGLGLRRLHDRRHD
ncbi:MAG: hypothetical protein M3495_08100 [Pseudomonadota bacterium]|nr:hypothetical protein [Pseudomonadota bacterium]